MLWSTLIDKEKVPVVDYNEDGAAHEKTFFVNDDDDDVRTTNHEVLTSNPAASIEGVCMITNILIMML